MRYRNGQPPLAVRNSIVIRDGQEGIPVVDIPLRDLLGKIISVTPERVRVEIALVPLRFRRGLAAGQYQNESGKQGKAGHRLATS